MSWFTDKRVCILGGAGMIGSQLVELLVKEKAEITVIDNFSRGRRENVAGLMCQIEQIDLLGNPHAMRDTFRWHRFDIVFNLAAKVTGMHYNKDHHAEMFNKNIGLMMLPLSAAFHAGVPYFLQASTVCVYPRDMSYPVTEDEGHDGEPEPTNAGYGWAKRMGEKYAQWMCQETDMKIGITRFSNCFGPRDYFDDETSHVIPALIKRFLDDDLDEVTVYGSGNQIREFLYSRDAAIGAMEVLQHFSTAIPVNIGNPNNRITINDLARLIGTICESTKPIVNVEGVYPEGYPRRGSSIELLASATGWAPMTPLGVGLYHAVQWYKGNREIA